MVAFHLSARDRRRLVALFLGIITLILVSGCSSFKAGKNPDEEFVATAEAQMAAGSYTAAERTYQQASAAAPDDAAPLMALADLYLKWSHPEAGLEALEKADSLGAAPSEIASRRLSLLIAAGKWTDVIETAEEALKDETIDEDTAWQALVQAYLEQYACADAADAARHLLALHPSDTRAQRTHALLTGDLKALEGTDPLLTTGLATCQANCELTLGLRLVRSEEWGPAACVLTRGVQAEPTGETHMWLGEALARLGQSPTAEEHFLKAVDLTPESSLAWLLLGKFDLTQGNFERARVALLNAQRLDPTSPAPCLGMAEVKADAGKYDEISRWIDAALERSGEDPEIWKAAARFYLTRGLVEDGRALEIAERTVMLAPDDPEAQTLLGWAQLASGDPTGAAATLSRAVALGPDVGEAYYLQARTYRDLGSDAKADEAMTRARDLGFDPSTR